MFDRQTFPALEQSICWCSALATATCLAAWMRVVYDEAESNQPGRPLHDPFIVDDNRDRKFLDVVQIAFRSLTSRHFPDIPMLQKPKFRDSASDPMVQLADMLCGAAGERIDGNSAWFDLVASNCVGVVELP